MPTRNLIITFKKLLKLLWNTRARK